MIIGICGLAGSGKDTIGRFLHEDHGFATIAFADPIKRCVKEIYGFSEERLWGTSEERSRGDGRYPITSQARQFLEEAKRGPDWDPSRIEDRIPFDFEVVTGLRADEHFLSARKPCQLLGTEMGRECYPNTWIDLGLRVARQLDGQGCRDYDRARGIFPASRPPWSGVAITDVRFQNELQAIQEAGGAVIRVTRPSAGLRGSRGVHASEVEMTLMGDELFDVVIANDRTLAHLRSVVKTVISTLGG